MRMTINARSNALERSNMLLEGTGLSCWIRSYFCGAAVQSYQMPAILGSSSPGGRLWSRSSSENLNLNAMQVHMRLHLVGSDVLLQARCSLPACMR